VIRDEARTRWLESHGYRVMRIWNRDLFQRTDEVLDAISRALTEPPFRPPPADVRAEIASTDFYSPSIPREGGRKNRVAQ